MRSSCTQATILPRTVRVRSEQICDVTQRARARQQTPEFKAIYSKRADIEGTLSQGLQAFELRRSRYIGEAKTHLQHLWVATALNIVRLFAWHEQRTPEQTRRSCFAALAPSPPALAAG
ncbi:transposase [Ktedonobacter sp. SOSP1-52]|uniref:transposase n=1 Tax=Ktedonobacter sp. SOSP1-52 TaxID=2778366 RepID=UPI001916B0C3|nr:transposase [Ktedonobacter sp. SOSP1-52]